MNLAMTYQLAQGVAIRPERFGGLVYRYDNRRLYFLHSHEMVDFVRGLDGLCPLGEALDGFIKPRGLPESMRDTLLKAVVQLEKLGILVSACAEVTKAPPQIQPEDGAGAR